MNIRKAIGKNIKKARLDMDISQENLAARLNTSHQNLNKIENGNYSFLNVDVMWQIAQILQVPFHKLFEID